MVGIFLIMITLSMFLTNYCNMLGVRFLFLSIIYPLLGPSSVVYGQDRVNIKINLSGIDREKLVVHFDDGIVLDIINLNQGDSTTVVVRTIYTFYPSISALYDVQYYLVFFIGCLFAILSLFYVVHRKNAPFYAD